MLSFTQSRNHRGDLINSYEAYVSGKLVSLVSMNPNHPDVANPGMWGATIQTYDGGLFSLGLFDDGSSAVSVAQWARKNNRRLDEWVYFYKFNNLSNLKGKKLYMKLLKFVAK